MTRQPDSDEPVDQWTLLPDELRLVAGKPTTNRLGFALMLKFFARRGRFPRGRGEVPNAAIEYVAKQVEVAPTESSWKKPYTDRGIRKILARYSHIPRPVSPHRRRHFLFTWLKTQGLDDALIQPYSGHATRRSLEVYSHLALADAQQRYQDVIEHFPV